MTNYIPLICPFCGESDFDAIGLKMHLLRWCEEFAKIQLAQPRDL